MTQPVAFGFGGGEDVGPDAAEEGSDRGHAGADDTDGDFDGGPDA